MLIPIEILLLLLVLLCIPVSLYKRCINVIHLDTIHGSKQYFLLLMSLTILYMFIFVCNIYFLGPVHALADKKNLILPAAVIPDYNTPGYVSPEAVRAALMADPSMLVDAARKLQEDAVHQRLVASNVLIDKSRDELNKPTAGFLGNPDGHDVVVEFFDYQCIHCRDAAPELIKAVKANPELKIILRDMAVLGQGSVIAARAALAAGQQGFYMPMHDELLKADVPITQQTVDASAKSIGLDISRFHADMAPDDLADKKGPVSRVLMDTESLSRRIGVTGTPAFASVGHGMQEGFTNLSAFESFVSTHVKAEDSK